MTTVLLILTTNLLGLCAVLGYLTYMWRERALKAEAWRELVSDKGTDYIAVKATGEPFIVERQKPPEVDGGGFLTGRQRMQRKIAERDFAAVTPKEVLVSTSGLTPENMEHLNG